MKKLLPACIALGLSCAPALGLTLELPGEGERTSMRYECSDSVERPVEYVNVGENRLALVTIDGEPRLFVNVISGSGARYVAGTLEWWSKGAEATFTDAFEEDGAQPVTCQEVEGRE
ncbi:MliC family protein [Aureimonas mangrovi]|uniref:MliC family protein n=1 Tax=Aureimonas mangrovi TaxID=2758041 RepID=UPI00163DA78A|nr:MliC family protein [Aureimonas mangrovi]